MQRSCKSIEQNIVDIYEKIIAIKTALIIAKIRGFITNKNLDKKHWIFDTKFDVNRWQNLKNQTRKVKNKYIKYNK